MKTILVTGGAGYVGSGLLFDLVHAGHEVVCVDTFRFGGESILSLWHQPNFHARKIDITDFDAVSSVFDEFSFDAIIHLAAIVGDPACKREPDIAYAVNWVASKNLVDEAARRSVQKFVFASTCSNYGKMANSNDYVDENSPLAPVSLYAELKVKFENYMMEEMKKDDSFSPTALRFSTVYGVSPRMRFDLTVNEFTKDLTMGKELVIFGEQFWRPYCHVRDFSRAFMAVLDAPLKDVAYDVFNVGDTSENYTKQMIVDEISKVIDHPKIKYVEKNEDPRDYRVRSDKIKERLGFELSMKVPDGIREVKEIVQSGITANPDDQRYYNIPYAG